MTNILNRTVVFIFVFYLTILGFSAPANAEVMPLNTVENVAPACGIANATLAVMAFNEAKFVALALSNCDTQMLVTVKAAGMQKESGFLVWGDGTFAIPPNTMTALEIDVSHKENLQIKAVRSKALISVTSALVAEPLLDVDFNSVLEQ